MTELSTYVCIDCNGSEIIAEQPQKWDVDKQEWVNSDFAEFWCFDCDIMTDAKRVGWHPILPKVKP